MSEGTAAEEVRHEADFLSLDSIGKTYGSTKALSDVKFVVRSGEVLGLLGANGAGKSTLLNIVGGTVAPTTGTMTVENAAIDFAHFGPLASRRAGIQRVFQELSTFSNLTVAENFSMTTTVGRRLSGRAGQKNARERFSEVFPSSRVSPRAQVGDLTLAEQQMVEIARAATEPGLRLLILDEPTSALSASEAAQLGEFITRRAAAGLAVIYVTHKLDEVLTLADRLVLLRDGTVHWEGTASTATHDELLIQLGAAPVLDNEETAQQPHASSDGNDVLVVNGLSGPGLHEASLTVRRGEIVGLAGLEGAGQRPLLQQVFARRKRRNARSSINGSAAYVSGDRQREGILPLWNVLENVAISAIHRASVAGFVSRRRQRLIAEPWLNDLGLSHRSESGIVELSGGNQQRALLGRALASGADLLLLDDPTRGVDVGAKRDIYEILERAKHDGRSALFYSTENAEFQRCDRVYVMAEGTVVAELPGSLATEDRIMQASYTRPDPGNRAAARSDRPESAPQRLLRTVGRLAASRPAPATVLFIGMLIAVISIQPNVANPFALNLLLQSSTIIAFAALAQMLFILGGDIDLGLGFAVGLVNVIGATLLATNPALGVLALLAVVAGYIVMALLVELFAVPSVVVTLGASFVWLGAGMLLQDAPGGNPPDWLAQLTRLRLAPLPEAFYLLLAAVLLGLLIVRGWKYGTILRALGNNGRTLIDLGYSALRARVTLYVLSAIFVVVTGLLVTANTGSSDINASAPLTLASVAAVIVGGASFAGGRVSPVGAVLAAIGLSLISSLLVFTGVSSQYSTAIGGIVLILVLGLRAFVRKSTE